MGKDKGLIVELLNDTICIYNQDNVLLAENANLLVTNLFEDEIMEVGNNAKKFLTQRGYNICVKKIFEDATLIETKYLKIYFNKILEDFSTENLVQISVVLPNHSKYESVQKIISFFQEEYHNVSVIILKKSDFIWKQHNNLKKNILIDLDFASTTIISNLNSSELEYDFIPIGLKELGAKIQKHFRNKYQCIINGSRILKLYEELLDLKTNEILIECNKMFTGIKTKATFRTEEINMIIIQWFEIWKSKIKYVFDKDNCILIIRDNIIERLLKDVIGHCPT